MVTAAHLRAMVGLAQSGLKQKSEAMSNLTYASLVGFILATALLSPVLFLSVPWSAKLACGGLIVACAIGSALTQLGYRMRRSLEHELKARLVDVEQCPDAKQEHYIRRAQATVRKANDHLGAES